MADTLATLLHELAVGCTYGYGEAAHAEGHKVHAARLASRGVIVGLDVEAAHVVEQQGLALGRLRAAAQAVVAAWGDGDEWKWKDMQRHIVQLRAALEEVDRG